MRSQPRTVVVDASFDAVVVDVPLGPAIQDLLQRDSTFEAGEAGAEAEVGAVAEGQVTDVVAVDVEDVGLLEATIVAVRRRHDRQDGAARGHGDAVTVDVLHHVPRRRVPGGLVAQRLLDHAGDERAVGDDSLALLRMLGEDLGQPADEPASGLVPGAREDRGVRGHLLARERATCSVVVLELGSEQLRHQVVGRMVGAPLDVVLEEVTAGDLLLFHLHRLARLGAQVGVGVLAHRDLILFGDAEQHADDPHRHLAASSATMSNRLSPTNGSRHATQNARTWSSSSSMRRGVNTRDNSFRCTVCSGGSSNSSTPGGSSMSALMMSRMSLWVLEKVRQSISAWLTSS